MHPMLEHLPQRTGLLRNHHLQGRVRRLRHPATCPRKPQFSLAADHLATNLQGVCSVGDHTSSPERHLGPAICTCWSQAGSW